MFIIVIIIVRRSDTLKNEVIKYIKFSIGIMFCALGVVIIMKTQFGASPWDVLNQGIHSLTGISIGRANTLVGVFAIVVALFFKQPIGSGSILNLIFIGEFINFFLKLISNLNIIENNLFFRYLFLFIGILIFSFGCFLYISVGLGCGPRDGLLVALTKNTRFSLRSIRIFLEIIALFLGWILGGHVGLGTVIFALLAGPTMQFYFRFYDIDVKKLQHRSLKEEVVMLKNFFNTKFKTPIR